MKDKPPPATARLDVELPVELYDRLLYMSRLPAHRSWGGTLETLLIRVLEEGFTGVAIAYERFEAKKPITDEVHQRAFGKPKAKTRMASGSKGKPLVHRR